MSRARVLVPFHAVVALVVSWPLALHLTDSIPQGIEPVTTVPLFNLWTLEWNQRQVGDLYRHYWDAPIFHPTPGAFALSEPQPLTGLFYAPIAWLTHQPALAYDVTVLVILLLNGLGAARLARRLGVGAGPAALAGALAQALPFVMSQFGVLQLTVLFPVFLLADAVLAWASRAGWWRALAMGAWLAATFLTCGYYALFSVVVVGLAALTLVRRSWLVWVRAGQLVAAAALFGVLTAPFLVGQAHYTDAYSRSEQTIESLSAEPVDFLRLDPRAPGASFAPWLRDEGGSAHSLYPGTALLGLATAGVVLAITRAARRAGPAPAGPSIAADADATTEMTTEATTEAIDDERDGRVDDRIDERRRVLFVTNAMFLALLLSLGLRVDVGGFRPYDLLRLHVPGFRNLRSPFRFAALMQVFLVPLAAIALDRLWRSTGVLGPRVVAGRRVAVGAVLAVVVVLAGAVEVTPLPQRLLVVPDPTGDWVTWLHDQPRAGEPGDGSVAMVPFPATGAVESYEATARAMRSGLEHDRPLVNGYSGFFPSSYDDLEVTMRGFPSARSVAALRAIPVTYVVVDRSWLTPEAQGWMHEWSRELTPVFEGRDEIVYRVNPA